MPIAIADAPPTIHRPFRGPDDTLELMVEQALGDRGERSPLIRSMKDHIVRKIQPKDYLGEILAIRHFAAEKVRYSNDALGVEQVQDPQRTAEQILAHGSAVGDCFPEGTVLLGEGHKFVRIEDVKVGDKIWGLDRWSTVEGKAQKGILHVSRITLLDGTKISLTADHKVYVRSPSGEVRIHVSEVSPGMVLVKPDSSLDLGGTRNLKADSPVQSVVHYATAEPCWDIQTDDHRVYLPEHDVTVSNCDDIATFIGALARQAGREVEFVVVGFGRPGNYSHVFARVKEPKTSKWIVCDPVAGTGEAAMLQRVTTWKSVKVDK